MIVDLPLPVCPMRAIRSHFFIVKSISDSTSRSLDGYENERFWNVIVSDTPDSIVSHSSVSLSMANSSLAFS